LAVDMPSLGYGTQQRGGRWAFVWTYFPSIVCPSPAFPLAYIQQV